MKDPRENPRDKIIERIVQTTPFVINCEAAGKCDRYHPAVWFVSFSCGCVRPVCDAGRQQAEQVFKHGLAIGELRSCGKHGDLSPKVLHYQPVPAYDADGSESAS